MAHRRMLLVCAMGLMLSACGGNSSEPATIANGPGTPPRVNTSPDEQPAPQPAPVEPAQPAVSQTEADYVSFPGGLKAFPAESRVELEAHLLSEQTRPLEFLLVVPGGAFHESLFAASAKGEHLKRALEIIGLKEGKEKRFVRGYLEKPVGDRVKISVRFRHRETGKLTVTRVENWLIDFSKKESPEPVGWIFTGSHENYSADLNRSAVDADLKGNLIALWRDPSCVLDNDRANGVNSNAYSPNPDAPGMPEEKHGVPRVVTLIFEPHK